MQIHLLQTTVFALLLLLDVYSPLVCMYLYDIKILNCKYTFGLRIEMRKNKIDGIIMQIYLLQHHSFWYRKYYVFLTLIKNTLPFNRDVFLTKSLFFDMKVTLFYVKKCGYSRCKVGDERVMTSKPVEVG